MFNKFFFKYNVILCISIFLFYCSNYEHITEINDIELHKISEIRTNENDTLNAMTKYTYSQSGDIYIYDNINGYIVSYNKYGKMNAIIGSKGKGPGQFLRVMSIASDTQIITVYDIEKRKILKFKENGDFVTEFNYDETFSIYYTSYFDNHIIGSFKTWVHLNNIYYEKKGVGIFSDSYDLIETILYSMEVYDPTKIDPNDLVPILAIDSKNSVIAYTPLNSRDFHFIVRTINSKDSIYEQEYFLKLPPVKYTKDEYLEIHNYYKEQIKKIDSNRNIKMIPVERNKRLITGMAFDEASNLWVLSPTKEKNRLLIFGKDKELKGYIIVKKDFGRIWIVENMLYNIFDTEDGESSIEIYEITRRK